MLFAHLQLPVGSWTAASSKSQIDEDSSSESSNARLLLPPFPSIEVIQWRIKLREAGFILRKVALHSFNLSGGWVPSC